LEFIRKKDMNNTEKDEKRISRRDMLTLGVGALVGAGVVAQPLSAAIDVAAKSSHSRALLCIYLIGGAGDKHLAMPSAAVPGAWELNPSAAELRRLHESGELLLLTTEQRSQIKTAGARPGEAMAQRYAGLRFLPSGFATPEWAAQAAQLQGMQGGAYTFHGGLSVVSRSVSASGAQFENLELRRSMARLPALSTTFPDTTLGRQLSDVTRLLRLSDRLDLVQPVFLCTAAGFTDGAARAGLIADRYRELSQAVASFHDAIAELGMEERVTTYTDAELSTKSQARMSARFVMGAAALSPASAQGLTANGYQQTLTAWLGYAA
jgi:hypothetical protein